MIDTQLIKNTIRAVQDFPKEGIIYKDITPILKNHAMCSAIVAMMHSQVKDLEIDVVAGIESRGFLFGMMLANVMQKPFIPIRKAGKLPYKTFKQSYALEYGEAEIEVHIDAFETGQKVLIHDDLLATGGTVEAAAQLIEKCGAHVSAFSFLAALEFLGGKSRLSNFKVPVFSCVTF